VRAFMPHARHVVLHLLGERSAEYEMHRAHPEGLYQTQIPRTTDSIDYEYLVQEEGGAPYRCSDPYRFRGIRFSREDQRLFVRGEHLRLFEKLGARPAVLAHVGNEPSAAAQITVVRLRTRSTRRMMSLACDQAGFRGRGRTVRRRRCVSAGHVMIQECASAITIESRIAVRAGTGCVFDA
jgi:hypothetical protein